jgi:hypothetical protein
MEKRWQFVAVASDEAFIAAAVANFGYLGVGFAYAQRRDTGENRRYELKTPLGLGAVVATEPDAGYSRLSAPDGLIVMDAHPARLRIEVKAFQADLSLSPGTPWDAHWNIPTAGAHRTRKRAGDPAAGRLRWDGVELPIAGRMMSDWSRGHLARETQWRWATGVGMAGGRVIGWNLRTGFDDPTEAENAVWVDGSPAYAGKATIVPGDRWRVAADDLELQFEPEGVHTEDVDLWLVASRYAQPWGRFTGTWRGEPLEGYGVVEDHWARW